MKKTIIGILSAIILLLGGNYAIDNLGGGRINLTRTQCHTATTTANITYKAADAASSTCIAYIGDTTSASLQFMAYSTTTEPNLVYQLYATNDEDNSVRNWFYVDDSIESQTIATSTDNLYGMYSFDISNLTGEYLKVEYAVGSAASDIYLEVITQNEKY